MKSCIRLPALLLACLLLCSLLPAPARAEEGDFAASLRAAGFPESYVAPLCTLHDAHPAWVFAPAPASVSWDDALTLEYALGVSLVPDSSPTAYKSMQMGAYNYAASRWVELDSGGWVAASRAIIAYYMDPRNSLSEEAVFQFLSQSYDPAVQTREGLASLLAGSFLADASFDTDLNPDNGIGTWTDGLLSAAEATGISPYVLATMLLQEQGRSGGSESVSGKNAKYPGYYNAFNVGAYKAPGFTAVERGLWYASGANAGAGTYGRPWTSPALSLQGGAEYYRARYFDAGQTTLYLKRFNVQGDQPCTRQYMTNVAGALSEGKLLSQAYAGALRDAALQFSIPVFAGLPETACPLPGTATPPAEPAPETVPAPAEPPVEPTPAAPEAPAEPAEPAEPPAGPAPEQPAGPAEFPPEAAPSPENPPTETSSPVSGDVDGDGTPRINDLIRLRNHLLGTATLEGAAFTAADMDGDGVLRINDLIRIRNLLLGTL